MSNEREDYASGNFMIHSDTLYAAIFFAWNRLGKPEWIPNGLNPQPSFTISSLFPYFQNTYFLPRPFYTPEADRDSIDNTSIRKSIKKAAWVDTVIFEELLNDIVPKYIESNNFKDIFWSSQPFSTATSFITSQIVPRVSISRVPGEDTRIFYIEKFYFQKEAGLYFLVQFDNVSEKLQLEAALHFLGDEGIGTDRNIGHGKFTFSEQPVFQINCKKQHGLAVNLGLFCPENKTLFSGMLDHSSIGYDLMKRGGWLSEPYQTWRKKSVYMLREGSVLQLKENLKFFALGENVNVNPDTVPVNHPVWRCGKTIFLSF